MQYWLLSIAKQALQMKDLNSTEGWKFSWNDGKDEDLTQFTSRPPEQFDELVIAAVMMTNTFFTSCAVRRPPAGSLSLADFFRAGVPSYKIYSVYN